MLLPGCVCCGPTCQCEAAPYDGASTVAFTSTNPCCATSCLPCSLTLAVTPGSVWASALGLASGDRAALVSYMTRTFVFSLSPSPPPNYSGVDPLIAACYSLNFDYCQYPGAYSTSTTRWAGSFVLTNDVPDAAGSQILYNSTLANASSAGCASVTRQITGNNGWCNRIQAQNSSGTIVTLPSGITISSLYIDITPTFSDWQMPFGLGTWCGLSSWSYSFACPYGVTIFDTRYNVNRTHNASIVANGYDPSSMAAVNGVLRGNTINFSW